MAKNIKRIMTLLLTVLVLNMTAVNTYADVDWTDPGRTLDFNTENTELIEILKSKIPDRYDISISDALIISGASITEYSVSEYEDSKYLLVIYKLNDSDYWTTFYVDQFDNVNVAGVIEDGNILDKPSRTAVMDKLFGKENTLVSEEVNNTNTNSNTDTENIPGWNYESVLFELYEGCYMDARAYGDNPDCPPDYTVLNIYNIQDTTFDFNIKQWNPSTGTMEYIFMDNTAEFNNDGTATFHGQEYTLTFTQSDITSLYVSGFGPAEGICYSCNSIPGHEFS